MPNRNEAQPLSEAKTLAAMLALLVADREERAAPDSPKRKTEVILASAGLTAAEIAPLVGKKYDAVAKTIQRAKGDSNG